MPLPAFGSRFGVITCTMATTRTDHRDPDSSRIHGPCCCLCCFGAVVPAQLAKDNSWRSLKQHKEAQVRMIEEVLSWAEVSSNPDGPKTILDVGCGVGGSSRYLQKKYGAKVTGITLSPKQQAQATALSSKSGQAESCDFRVADALNMPFEDNSFDLVWSLESGEHMPEKPKQLGIDVKETKG